MIWENPFNGASFFCGDAGRDYLGVHQCRHDRAGSPAVRADPYRIDTRWRELAWFEQGCALRRLRQQGLGQPCCQTETGEAVERYRDLRRRPSAGHTQRDLLHRSCDADRFATGGWDRRSPEYNSLDARWLLWLARGGSRVCGDQLDE